MFYELLLNEDFHYDVFLNLQFLLLLRMLTFSNNQLSEEAGFIYAYNSDGSSVEVAQLHSDGNREWIDSDKIPGIAKNAAIAIEDERFYKHHGIDLKRTAGAVVGWVTSKITGKSPSYGGSTITQQVIKNITNERDKTAVRKIKEMKAFSSGEGETEEVFKRPLPAWRCLSTLPKGEGLFPIPNIGGTP